MVEAEQVITVKVSILNVQREGTATVAYSFNNATTLEELSEKFAGAVREATAQAVGEISTEILENAVSNFK